MEYGYENVLQIQRRCGVSFEDADKALKQAKGDVDGACIIAMRKKNQQKKDGWFQKTIDAITNFATYRVKVLKNGNVRFNIPMGVIILVVILYSIVVSEGFYWNEGLGFLFFVAFSIIVLTGHTLSIEPGEKKEAVLDIISTETMDEDTALEVFSEQEVKEDEEGYSSVEIE